MKNQRMGYELEVGSEVMIGNRPCVYEVKKLNPPWVIVLSKTRNEESEINIQHINAEKTMRHQESYKNNKQKEVNETKKLQFSRLNTLEMIKDWVENDYKDSYCLIESKQAMNLGVKVKSGKADCDLWKKSLYFDGELDRPLSIIDPLNTYWSKLTQPLSFQEAFELMHNTNDHCICSYNDKEYKVSGTGNKAVLMILVAGSIDNKNVYKEAPLLSAMLHSNWFRV